MEDETYKLVPMNLFANDDATLYKTAHEVLFYSFFSVACTLLSCAVFFFLNYTIFSHMWKIYLRHDEK